MSALRYEKKGNTISASLISVPEQTQTVATGGAPPVSRRMRSVPVWAGWVLQPIPLPACRPLHLYCRVSAPLGMSPGLSSLPPRSKKSLCRDRVLNRVGTQVTTAKATAPGASGFLVSLHAKWQACTVEQVEVLLGGEPHPPCPFLLPDL